MAAADPAVAANRQASTSAIAAPTQQALADASAKASALEERAQMRISDLSAAIVESSGHGGDGGSRSGGVGGALRQRSPADVADAAAVASAGTQRLFRPAEEIDIVVRWSGRRKRSRGWFFEWF